MPLMAFSVFVVVVVFFVSVLFLAQPGRTTKDNVITIADTTTSTFCLRVVISFPFLTGIPRFAYMRSTLFPFLPHQALGDSHTPIIHALPPVCQALSPPFRSDARSGVFPMRRLGAHWDLSFSLRCVHTSLTRHKIFGLQHWILEFNLDHSKTGILQKSMSFVLIFTTRGANTTYAWKNAAGSVAGHCSDYLQTGRASQHTSEPLT
jgi:hypothetical protein